MAFRSLTDGEIKLAKKVFGDSIDYAAVRLYDRRIFPPPLQQKGRAMAGKNAISFPGNTYSPDFSQEADAKKQSVFIHELVHVWQHQNKVVNTYKEFAKEMLRHKFKYDQAYFYALAPAKDLTAYNFEQQAGIVQDYFLLTTRNCADSYKSRRKTEGDAEFLKKLYESVLGSFLKNPGYASTSPKKRPPHRPSAA